MGASISKSNNNFIDVIDYINKNIRTIIDQKGSIIFQNIMYTKIVTLNILNMKCDHNIYDNKHTIDDIFFISTNIDLSKYNAVIKPSNIFYIKLLVGNLPIILYINFTSIEQSYIKVNDDYLLLTS